jgi:hypothetical protein
MSTSHVRERALAASFIAFGIGLALVPTASADPTDPVQPAPPAPGPVVQADAPVPGLPGDGVPPVDGGDAAKTACAQFARALNYAAVNYGDFADSIAGNGTYVNYGDPTVQTNNAVGRTALRQAATVAMDAAATPGLAPEIANPMRAWSMNAAKLMLVMGVRAGGDTIDGAATDVNNNTHDVQMACAQAGTHA